LIYRREIMPPIVHIPGTCRRFGVSRRIGYKWLARYQALGVEGLVDRSRAPLNHPQTVAAAIAERCLMTRRKHPTWGPVKVRAWLERHAPAIAWPAASTIGELFDREGLTVKRRLRRRSPPSSAPFAHCGAANDVWCIDFKGWFLTGDGTHCEPLTLSDAYSRYLLRCQALSRTDDDHVWPVVDAAFREFGLPKALRSDNGPPFEFLARCLTLGVGRRTRSSIVGEMRHKPVTAGTAATTWKSNGVASTLLPPRAFVEATPEAGN
jgi:putative transposase